MKKSVETDTTEHALIEPGKKAPDFRLKDQDGNIHRLADHRGKWVILYFYPKDMTPGCTTEACDFKNHYTRLQHANTVVYGVSRDTESSHKKFIQKHNLPFPLLVDPDGDTARKYGAWGEKNLYGKKTSGIVRTSCLINPQGMITRYWAKVKVDGHVSDIIQTLKISQNQ